MWTVLRAWKRSGYVTLSAPLHGEAGVWWAIHVRHHVGSSGLVAVRLDGWAGFVMAVDFEDVAAGLMMEAESTRSDVVVVLM